jgi:hypothetical protein
VDPQGYAYIGGYTYSRDFPTVNALQTTNAGGYDAFVAKLNPSGSALVYSTYLGGSEGDDGWGIAADAVGNAYIVGRTQSQDFPTKNPLQPYGGGMDAFVAKINPSGSALVYSTFLGGNGQEIAQAVAVDSTRSAYIAGMTSSVNFATKNALQSYGRGDAFIVKLNPAGSRLLYSTFLGGSGEDSARGLAIDCVGNVYLTGYTQSSDFPTRNPLQPVYGGYQDAFVAKFAQTGSALLYATYLGGSSDEAGYGIAADCNGNAYVIGTTSSINFPTASPLQRHRRNIDAFLTKINSVGSAFYFSSFLGGSNTEDGWGIAANDAGYAFVTGETYSSDFPTLGSLHSYAGSGDAYVAKIAPLAWTKTALVPSPNPSVYGQPVTLTATVSSDPGLPPDGEVMTFKQGTTVLGTGSLASGSTSVTTLIPKAGTILLKAVYGGDRDFAASSSTISQVVSKATTTTMLVSILNPSTSGQSVTLAATVTPQFNGTPAGTVTFYEGTMALKTVYLRGGAATFTTKTFAAGTHTITATYNGSAYFTGSSGSLTQVVK